MSKKKRALALADLYRMGEKLFADNPNIEIKEAITQLFHTPEGKSAMAEFSAAELPSIFEDIRAEQNGTNVAEKPSMSELVKAAIKDGLSVDDTIKKVKEVLPDTKETSINSAYYTLRDSKPAPQPKEHTMREIKAMLDDHPEWKKMTSKTIAKKLVHLLEQRGIIRKVETIRKMVDTVRKESNPRTGTLPTVRSLVERALNASPEMTVNEVDQFVRAFLPDAKSATVKSAYSVVTRGLNIDTGKSIMGIVTRALADHPEWDEFNCERVAPLLLPIISKRRPSVTSKRYVAKLVGDARSHFAKLITGSRIDSIIANPPQVEQPTQAEQPVQDEQHEPEAPVSQSALQAEPHESTISPVDIPSRDEDFIGYLEAHYKNYLISKQKFDEAKVALNKYESDMLSAKSFLTMEVGGIETVERILRGIPVSQPVSPDVKQLQDENDRLRRLLKQKEDEEKLRISQKFAHKLDNDGGEDSLNGGKRSY